MPFFSQLKHHFNPPPANGLGSQSTQQAQPVCTWSAHTHQPGPSPSPFPRDSYALTATATAAGELFLFGGFLPTGGASNDLYVLSTRDFSTTLLQTSGEVPSPRLSLGAALISTTLLICGGEKNLDQNVLNHDSLYLLNIVLRKWTRVVVNGPGPGGRYLHTVTMIGSKLFVFGGQRSENVFNDMWALDLNSLKSQHRFWESYEPAPGNDEPLPRAGHVSVNTEDRIIIFGGIGDEHLYNDTWSFNISTRKWTELQCTGSIPSPRANHAAILVDDVMYVFGGFTGKTYLDSLYALQLSTQRWFEFHNVGPRPLRRSHHAMASDGTCVFVLGGQSMSARSDEVSLIHVFDTKDIKYPEPERNAVNPNEKTTKLAWMPKWRSSTGLQTLEQPQHPKSSSSEAYSASSPQNAPPAVSGPCTTPSRVPEGGVSEGPTMYHAKTAELHHSSEGEDTRLELERQLSVSHAVQAERDQPIAQLTDELGANAAEYADRLLAQTSLVKQRDVELMGMKARLVSHDQQIGQYEKELKNVHGKLEAKEYELEAVRSRLTDAEKALTESKAEADTLRAQTASGSANTNEDQVIRRLFERLRIDAEVALNWWYEKGKEMECRNEGMMNDDQHF